MLGEKIIGGTWPPGRPASDDLVNDCIWHRNYVSSWPQALQSIAYKQLQHHRLSLDPNVIDQYNPRYDCMHELREGIGKIFPLITGRRGCS